MPQGMAEKITNLFDGIRPTDQGAFLSVRSVAEPEVFVDAIYSTTCEAREAAQVAVIEAQQGDSPGIASGTEDPVEYN